MSDFLRDYSVEQSDFDKSGLDWNELGKIYKDYSLTREPLKPIARYVAEQASQIEGVHAVKFRVKKPGSLIRKIITKCARENDLIITKENYKDELNDFIGVRILHLFKSQWITIHEELEKLWDFTETPEAYYVQDDPPYLKKLYEENNRCEAKISDRGYRSIHYAIEPKPCKISAKAEIQVRTIFEEAWGETDHEVKYPQYIEHEELRKNTNFISLFAGSCDELASITKLIRESEDLKKQNQTISIIEKSKLIVAEIDEKTDEFESNFMRRLRKRIKEETKIKIL